jgi:hypothetical protein
MQWLAKARTELNTVTLRYDKIAVRVEEISELTGGPTDDKQAKDDHRVLVQHNRWVRLANNVLRETAVIYVKTPQQKETSIDCDNDDYYFELRKPSDDKSFVLTSYSAGNRKVPLRQGGGYCTHHAMMRYIRQALKAIEKEKGVVLQELRFDGDRQLLLIVLVMDEISRKIWLDSSHDWRVMEVVAESAHCQLTHSFAYGHDLAGFVFPSEQREVSKYKANVPMRDSDWKSRVISVGFTDKAESDFRLSAFGLPEPMGMPAVDGTRSRWYLGLAAAGVTAIGIGVWLRTRRRAVSVT